VEEIAVAEGCLSNTLDIVVIYAAIMVYKVQIILHNVLAINEKKHKKHTILKTKCLLLCWSNTYLFPFTFMYSTSN